PRAVIPAVRAPASIDVVARVANVPHGLRKLARGGRRRADLRSATGPIEHPFVSNLGSLVPGVVITALTAGTITSRSSITVAGRAMADRSAADALLVDDVFVRREQAGGRRALSRPRAVASCAHSSRARGAVAPNPVTDAIRSRYGAPWPRRLL